MQAYSETSPWSYWNLQVDAKQCQVVVYFSLKRLENAAFHAKAGLCWSPTISVPINHAPALLCSAVDACTVQCRGFFQM